MTPHVLQPDEKITEPGLYQMSLERHHNQPCDGVSVTSGILRKMEMATPADVWAFHALNPDRWEKPETDALRMGRAMASFVEGGTGAVLRDFLLLPYDRPRRPTTAQIRAYDEGRASSTARASVEFWRNVSLDDRPILKQEELDLIEAMGKVLASDPAASAVMAGMPEVTLAYYDEPTDLWILSRPDVMTLDGVAVDYKKMATQGGAFHAGLVDQRITAHGYDMQGALFCEGFQALTGEWPAFGIVAQWDQPPHHVILRDIPDEDLRIGAWRNRRAMRRFRECLDSGNWPGPGEHVGSYHRPDWQREKLLQEMNTEGVAP